MTDDIYYGHMFGWGLGGIMMLVFWAAVVLFIVWAVKEARRGGSDDARSKSALDILKERYAKGEIDKKELEEKRKDLDD